jgi:heme A synthase
MFLSLIGGLQGLVGSVGFTLPSLKHFTGSSDVLASLLLALAVILLVWPHFYRRTVARRKARKISAILYPARRLDINGNFSCR